MKPPMNQLVKINKLLTDEQGKPIKDKYGRPQTVTTESKARVQYKSQLITDTQGQSKRISLEIDLPPENNPEVGTEIQYVTIDGKKASGTIESKDEAINLAGNRVHFRTVYIN